MSGVTCRAIVRSKDQRSRSLESRLLDISWNTYRFI